jgi:hypothetical protein
MVKGHGEIFHLHLSSDYTSLSLSGIPELVLCFRIFLRVIPNEETTGPKATSGQLK